MRQEEKQAAATTHQLLGEAAALERKAAAARARKGPASARERKGLAAVQMRKGGGSRADAPVQMGEGRAAASPTPFSDGSSFFTGTGPFTSTVHSPQSQAWMFTQSSDPAAWDNNPTPPGGFTNFIQPHLSQNFDFVGGPAQYAPFKPPQPIDNPTAVEEISTPDSGDDLPRTEKRIIWTQEEDVRLMSSWLYNSTDQSIDANRKNEQYWNDVVETYNETTPSHRRRNAKQAKDRWHKVNKWIDLFYNAWLKARRIYTSGYNEQMWIEKAHTFYIKDNEELKLEHFVLMNVWYAVRDEAKWITYNKGLKQARKRNKSDNRVNEGEIEADLEEVEEIPRPMGQKKAKKVAQDKKGKAKVSDSDIEELNIFSKLQSKEHANRLKVLEIQQKLSSKKLEQAKLAHLVAKEQKEAAK
ncbi:hypothetical protein E2562_038673 [Oryza meyeriana var. granulata]|uniref:Myb-like domain-containing protein n=1 Tax=Oryza meyeriana var. granulata TaxID=110450 RepID=A0A6G1F2E6_9ORYZ|nr:hypothetical protein E2562_038673 [Oryza meyeriana var. granulata]